MKKINLKHLNVDASEMLTREQLKSVFGGIVYEPTGKSYKCCWEGTTNCSKCVKDAKPDCVNGATAVAC